MTTRERKEAKAARLQGWADKRRTEATATINTISDRFHDDNALLTQPGHIPERARLIAREDRAFASLNKAKGMATRADGIEHQLATSIYSDDTDAIEQLHAKIAELEAERTRAKAINAAYVKARKAGRDAAGALADCVTAGLLTADDAVGVARSIALQPYHDKPYPPYHLTNLGGTIRRTKERIGEVERRQQRTAQAEAAPGGVSIVEAGDYAVVTFAEKPAREILDELRAAGFYWGRGSWTGQKAQLPASVRDLTTKGGHDVVA